MGRKVMRPDELSQKAADHLFKAVNEEKPMACVLIATAFIENMLMSLIASVFPNRDSSSLDNLLKPGSALADLSKSADLAYCLGLINKVMRENIKRVGEIRNLFAHGLELTTDFNDREVKKILDKITLPKVSGGTNQSLQSLTKNPRDKFTIVAIQLYMWIHMTIGSTKPPKAIDLNQVW
jgi:DNA-binding MltR family transcriptional regulator